MHWINPTSHSQGYEMQSEQQEEFDFDAHKHAAISIYLEQRHFYKDLSNVIKNIIEEALSRKSVKYHSIQSRAKDPTSFGNKAAKPSEKDPTKPKYPDPINEITDLAGVRVIVYFPKTENEVNDILNEEFSIIEQTNKGESLILDERFGYNSIHYLIKLKPNRISLPEYKQFNDHTVEIQVRTILQHAWAEIEHDIQYKTASTIPKNIKRRFLSLAGLLEIADREFEEIHNSNRMLEEEILRKVEGNQLLALEITPKSLKAFLDKKIGPDGRMSDFSYDWTVRILRKLGFETFDQIEACLYGIDPDAISREIYSTKQGQLTRFEIALQLGMGELFTEKHLWANEPWFVARSKKHESSWQKSNRTIGQYDPKRSTATIQLDQNKL